LALARAFAREAGPCKVSVVSARNGRFLLRGPWLGLAVLGASLITAKPLWAAGCTSDAALSACFDANSLWLPAGHASFISLPDTRVSGAGQASFGAASEWLHRPVVLHVASPDANGRDVHVVDQTLDTSFFLGFGLWKNLELTLAAPTRAYQSGAGSAGVGSQTAPPLERNAILNPRLGLGYSLDDALAARGVGLRVAIDASLPLANASEFAGERSVVAMPSAVLALRAGAFHLSASLGARLRSAVDFGGVRLGNQGFAALGAGVDVLDQGLLFVSLEAFGLPPLSNSRAASANSAVTDETLFPAEWLAAVHTSFERSGQFTLSVAAGSGIPLSTETRNDSGSSNTSHFLGLGTPDFRALVVLRFAPAEHSSHP
jgi:hypothetical protein